MAEENQPAQGQAEGGAQEQQFSIQKLYLKDVSFESPNSPAVFADGEWLPEVNIQLNSSNKSIGQDTFEVDLKITVTAKQNKKTAFLVVGSGDNHRVLRQPVAVDRGGDT